MPQQQAGRGAPPHQDAGVFRIAAPFATTYSRTGPGGQPQLSYRDAGRELSFSGDEIDRQETAMGELVTVTIERQVDAFDVRFTLIVPTVRVRGDEEVEFETTAVVTTDRSFAFVLPPGPVGSLQTYRIHQVQGTAQAGPFSPSG